MLTRTRHPLTSSSSSSPRLTPVAIAQAIDDFAAADLPRLERFWAYYRNPMKLLYSDHTEQRRWYRLAQELGIPPRITGRKGMSFAGSTTATSTPLDDRAAERREVVIENDIGWRIQSMIDFMVGKPIVIQSLSPSLAPSINAIIASIFAAAGGTAFLQDAALLGHIYGHVDLALRIDPALLTLAAKHQDLPQALTQLLRIELIEPRRGIPLLSPFDYRTIDAYIVRSPRRTPSTLERLRDALPIASPLAAHSFDLITPTSWSVYTNGNKTFEQHLGLTDGNIPVVHIQNIAQPFIYSGQSEVEPLIPSQDELNTRLSDRASRVTLQSFKMYLAKGIHGFDRARVGPGQIWSTDNTDASVESFGGDAHSPSEDAHIREIREALDKISAIPPLASGVVQSKIGGLSSANALRITLLALLNKTSRKRIVYGNGIIKLCQLILAALHNAGILLTTPTDRLFSIAWPDPLPQDTSENLKAAQAKASLGVPLPIILAELGYVLPSSSSSPSSPSFPALP